MIQITQNHFEFLEEAKKAFEGNPRLETYRNKGETYIALRYGMDRDCIRIFELGDGIGFFANIMKIAPQLYVGDLNES